MRWLPHLTVATMVQHQNRLLFVEERCDGEEVLNQPAGHVEKNESLIEAAMRETLEETGCEVRISALLGMYSHFAKDKNISYYRVCFIAQLIEQHHDRALDTDIIRALWLSPEEAMQQQHRFRSPLVMPCMQDFLKGQNFPLELIKEF